MQWNDTDQPVGFLITFRTYGTWLHGDHRGSVNRFRNKYRTRKLPAQEEWQRVNRERMKRDPGKLDAKQRYFTETAIRETCRKRNWTLLAVNARTNHVHSVVSNGAINGDGALNAFKSNATRTMRENGCWQSELSPWSDRGSKRNLWTERSLVDAIDYVLHKQGGPLPKYREERENGTDLTE